MSKKLWFRLFPLIPLILTMLVSVSCSDKIPAELKTSRKLWEDQNITDYDFTLQRSCFCPEDWRGPVHIEVRDGEVISSVFVSTGEDVPEGRFDDADTIDELFTILEDAYTGKGPFDQVADSVTVEYDDEMGFPVNFYIDVSQLMADEETGYTVTNFVVR